MPKTPSPETEPEFRLRMAPDITALPAASWDLCASISNNLDQISKVGHSKPHALLEAQSGPHPFPDNPFVSHAFLSALEASGCVGAKAGWLPRHLVLEGQSGQMLGTVPCYLKSHSRGEYVFDQGWAEAYERAGGDYYPKLQVSVPFTPATGPRLLVHPEAGGPNIIRRTLADGLIALCGEHHASGVHATFLRQDDREALAARGFLIRTDQQFHWRNPGYASFDDFLNALASRKRKFIRRERREALAPGIEIEWLSGPSLTEAAWDAFFAFYMETGSRKWGRPYLNRAFFSLIGEGMGERILLVMAKRAGRYIAGAINFIGGDTLYGRHWGAIEHHPFLHFEICYYQAMDFAISKKLSYVEAGAQGEHKLARGYAPVTTYSAHYLADPGLRRAVADYLMRERAYVDAANRELVAFMPFRKTADAED
jgi:predicted N-acyltransferase